MALRIIAKAVRRPLRVAGTAFSGLGLAAGGLNLSRRGEAYEPAAIEEFNKSYRYPAPVGWKGDVFKIRNDYPRLVKPTEPNTAGVRVLPATGNRGKPPVVTDPTRDAPWLQVDFKTSPEEYCRVIKEYCWVGNVENGFNVHKNKTRDWYHAPWMHDSPSGREPLHGLTFERPTPAFELSKTQEKQQQVWAIGFYNAAGKLHTALPKVFRNTS